MAPLNQYYIVVLLIAVSLFAGACKKKPRNYVPLEQIESDKSSNYRYIFKDLIKKEQRKEKKSKPDEFKQ